MPQPTTSAVLRRRGLVVLVALLAVMALLLAACGGGSGGGSGDAGDGTATTKSPYGDAPPVDPPAPDEVVLTVTGPSGSTDYTLAELREKATTSLTIDEPFIKEESSFTGVPMKELFTTAGITDDDEVDTIALNDYTFAAPAKTFTGSDAVIAVTQDGGDIAIDKGGPIRIIFPNDKPDTSNLDAWNWSLRSIKAQ